MSRITKPAPWHNRLLAPGMCGCWYCSRIVLSLRCPFAWPEQVVNGVTVAAGQCGDYKGHRESHTILVASAFSDAEEIVRLDAPPETLVAP